MVLTDYEKNYVATNAIKWRVRNNMAIFSDSDMQKMRKGIYHVEKWLKMFMSSAEISALTPAERDAADSMLRNLWMIHKFENEAHARKRNEEKAALLDQLLAILVRVPETNGMTPVDMMKTILQR